MVSGPGQLSQRTDGGPGNEKQPIRVGPGGAYGDRQAAIEQQRAAPLPQVPDAGGAGVPAYTGGPLNGPSERPGEPVTHGSPLGAGAGPEALTGAMPVRPGTGPMTQLLMSLGGGGATGPLAELLRVAQTQNQ